MTDIDRAHYFLAATQGLDGGWGYASGQGSSVEATSSAILALNGNLKDADTYQRGLAWLIAAQHDDGGWGIAVNDTQSSWQTAWALLALANTDRAAAERAADWLVAVKTPDPGEDAIEQVQPLLEIDLTLRGWPWRPAEVTWVEPTALAMLALVAANRQDDRRVAQAVRYLTDRRCRSGGWNVGNPVMFSQPLPPRAHPTAWALLALARVAPSQVLLDDEAALRASMAEDGGALALAWGLVALHTLGLDESAAAGKLAAQQRSDGSWNASPYQTAVALLAAGGRGLW